MIAQLSGKIARIEADYVVVDVGGVGYKVYMPLSVIAALPKAGESARVLTTTIVREDSITLYGFNEAAEQELFELLLGINGVGPKAALSMLSVLTVNEIIQAIRKSEHKELSRVPGIGGKTSQRIVLELSERITEFIWASQSGEVSESDKALDDAVEGLAALGYTRNDARKAAEKACEELDGPLDTGDIVRQALKSLGK